MRFLSAALQLQLQHPVQQFLTVFVQTANPFQQAKLFAGRNGYRIIAIGKFLQDIIAPVDHTQRQKDGRFHGAGAGFVAVKRLCADLYSVFVKQYSHVLHRQVVLIPKFS